MMVVPYGKMFNIQFATYVEGDDGQTSPTFSNANMQSMPGYLANNVLFVPAAEWWPNRVPMPGDRVQEPGSVPASNYRVENTLFHKLHGELTLRDLNQPDAG